MKEKERNDWLKFQRKINRRKTRRERRLLKYDRRQRIEARKKDEIERRINSEDRRQTKEDRRIVNKFGFE
ncbi:MAG: hypothetical protein AB1498_12930 [bacterium]